MSHYSDGYDYETLERAARRLRKLRKLEDDLLALYAPIGCTRTVQAFSKLLEALDQDIFETKVLLGQVRVLEDTEGELVGCSSLQKLLED
jgi:hypothetical protein